MEITVDMCVAGRDLTEPRLSPDGRSVAFVAKWGSNAAIVAVPASGGPERIVTSEPQPSPGRGFGGGCFDWLPDGSGVVYAARDGNLWLQPYPGGRVRRLTEMTDGSACAAPWCAADGERVAAVVDQAEIWEWSIDGAARRLDDGSADFVIDPSPLPVGAEAGWIWHAWNVPDMPWDASRAQIAFDVDGELRHSEFIPAASVQQLRHHPDGRRLSVRDDNGWLNVWLGDAPLVDEPFEHAGPAWGMGQRSYAVSPDGSRLAFTRNERGFGRLCVVDVATKVVTPVARGVHGQLSWVGNRVVALRSGARTPTQIVSYDADADWQRTVLAVGPLAGWDGVELPEPEPFEVEHDSTVLHARRYAAGNGRTICWIHGGPTDQWQVDFMPRVAYWWGQGWDVIVPDPRGSTGHGRAYQQALRDEWGRLDVDDTAAILAASHASGVSSSERSVMMGSSSGGLTVLGLLARHPDLASAGVTLYPVADLAVLADESHRFEAHYTLTLVGPLDDVATYTARSPVSYATAITAPLLVMHGDDDPVVPLSSTLALVDAIRSNGGNVELIVMEGEGHGFRDPANKRLEYERTLAFLGSVVGDAAR